MHAPSRRAAGAAIATMAAALAVAATVKRDPPDFAALAPIAVIRDAAGRPLWTIRLAPRAHQLAVDASAVRPPPAGRAFQLWLAGPGGDRSLGLLSISGRRVIPEIPGLCARLAGAGELLVSVEPAGGSKRRQPSGPTAYRAEFPDKG